MNNSSNTHNIFKNDNFKAIPSSFYTATHMQYVSKDGEVIGTKITSDFKLLYGLLFDRCRSSGAQDDIDGEKQDFYQDWDTIFLCIGRRYTDDKNSKRLVKLLEDSGILVQTKRPNTTNTNKVVFDVTTLNNVKFYNPELDCWETERDKRASAGFYGYYPDRTTDQDYLYVLNFNNKFIKVGRSFDVKRRISQLKQESKIKNIKKLCVLTGTHQEIYDLEQELHNELRERGFGYSVDWSTECFDNDSLGILNKLLGNCGSERVK